MSTAETSERARGRGSLIAGLILLVIGGWYFLESLGVDLPSMAAMWPIFPVVCGVVFLGSYAIGPSHDPGLVFPGTLSVLIGLFFFGFTFGWWDWYRMGELWPVFPLVVGLAFVATWLAGGCQKRGLLVPAAACLTTGLIGLGFTLGLFQDWFFTVLDVGWPLVLIVVGLMLVLRSVKLQRQSRSSDRPAREAGDSV
jgi:hypothetical protein